jgi:ABC-2 type transport system permease protein
MRDAWTLYWRYVGVSIRAQMQYRASFWMMTLSQFVATGVEFLGIWALFERFGSLRGWSLPEVALFYGIVNVAFALTDGFARGFDLFATSVKAGDFDRLLLRPRSTALQVAAQEVVLMRVGRLLQGLAVLLWAVANLPSGWDIVKALFLVAVIAGGACLFYGLFVLQATMAFWTVETLEIMNTVTYGGTETGQYPLTIYRPWFRRFFTFVVPIASMNLLPAPVLFGPGRVAGVPWLAAWCAPLIGVAFLLVCLEAWKLGVRHYTSTGS